MLHLARYDGVSVLEMDSREVFRDDRAVETANRDLSRRNTAVPSLMSPTEQPGAPVSLRVHGHEGNIPTGKEERQSTRHASATPTMIALPPATWPRRRDISNHRRACEPVAQA